MRAFSACLLISASLFGSAVSAKTVIPDTPEQMATSNQSSAFVARGEELLQGGDAHSAEESFRAALALENSNATADPGLAEALTAQGKQAEALQVYRALVYQYPRSLSSAAQEEGTLLRIALLLNQTGQWQEAVIVYQKALPHIPDNKMALFNVPLDLRSPRPAVLNALIHAALGLDANWSANFHGEFDHAKAFQEYSKALQLQPDSPLTNYFYGYGWQRLDPKEQARLEKITPGQQAAVKAAIAKAAKLGMGEERNNP